MTVSDLVRMECRVRPLADNDLQGLADFDDFFASGQGAGCAGHRGSLRPGSRDPSSAPLPPDGRLALGGCRRARLQSVLDE